MKTLRDYINLIESAQQGVAEGLGKDIKRGMAGWGAFDKDKPADVVKRVKGQDTDTLKTLSRTGPTGKGSPAELQQKAISRELKKREQQGVAEDDAGDVEQRMIAKIEKEKQRLAKLKQTDPEAYKREMEKRKTSSRIPPVSTFEGQGVAEAEKKGLYYYVNKRKKAGTSRDASSPKAPTAQAWKDAAKTAKKEDTEKDDAYMMELANKLAEKIPKGADVGYYIKDFAKSTAPQFKNKPPAKRRQMAIAAWQDSKKRK